MSHTIIKFLSFIFLRCLLFPSAFGQTQYLILTQEQNNKWLDSLKTMPLDQQLITTNDRLLSDTNIFISQRYNDRIRVTDSVGSRVYGEGKPALIIGGYPICIGNKTQTNKIVKLTQLLKLTNIKSIFIHNSNDSTAAALYGSAAQFGVIVMSVIKKKNIKPFKRLEL